MSKNVKEQNYLQFDIIYFIESLGTNWQMVILSEKKERRILIMFPFKQHHTPVLWKKRYESTMSTGFDHEHSTTKDIRTDLNFTHIYQLMCINYTRW